MYGLGLAFGVPQLGPDFDLTVKSVTAASATIEGTVDASGITLDADDANPGGAHTLWLDEEGTLYIGEFPASEITEPAGADKQIQFNDGGNFGADASMAFDTATQTLTVPSLLVDGTLDVTGVTTMSTNDLNVFSRIRCDSLLMGSTSIHSQSTSAPLRLEARASILCNLDSTGVSQAHTFSIQRNSADTLFTINADEAADGPGKLSIINAIENTTSNFVCRLDSSNDFIIDNGTSTLLTVDGATGALSTLGTVETPGVELGTESSNPGDAATLWTDGAGAYFGAIELTNQTTTPGGADNQLQFNDGGSFGASSDLVWTGAELQLGKILRVSAASIFTVPPYANGFEMQIQSSNPAGARCLWADGSSNAWMGTQKLNHAPDGPSYAVQINVFGEFHGDSGLYYAPATERLAVGGDLYVGADLAVTDDAAVGGNLTVAGATTFYGQAVASSGLFTYIHEIDGTDSNLIRLLAWQGDSTSANYRRVVTPTDLESSSYGANLRISTLGSGEIFRDSSSRRYKKNIHTLEPGVLSEAVLQMQPCVFDFKNGKGDNEIGFIAEDSYACSPYFTGGFTFPKGHVKLEDATVLSEDHDSVRVIESMNDRGIIAGLVECVQILRAELDELRTLVLN